MKLNRSWTLANCIVVSLVVGVATAGTLGMQDAPGANGLLAVDQNRATIADRIVAEWGRPLAESNVGLSEDQLRTLLDGLRADHLLAASLAGSLSGLRAVIANAISVADGKSGVLQTKATGDFSDDVVYTPVTPCRLVDTRAPFAAVYQNGGSFGAGAIRTYTIQGGNNVCLSQLPAFLGAAAVQLQVFGIPNAGSSGDIEILPQGATFGGTATEVYVGNVLINTVSTVAKINTTNNQISVQIRGGTADLAIDVVGYFRRPGNFGQTAISGLYATVAGGQDNNASGDASAVGGGDTNKATATDSVVAGGYNNTAGALRSAVGGGYFNTASGDRSVVAGGSINNASGPFSMIPGGLSNTASGAGSFAAGSDAHAGYDGCFVWGDYNTAVGGGVNCLAPNQVVMRAYGGYVLITGASPGYIGAQLQPGAGAWTTFSDRNGKSNLRIVDPKAVLRKVVSMPISTWNWKSQDETIRHMGPMAQDFHHAFGLGETPLGISTVDADGVALAAIKGLHQMILQKDAKLAQQSAKLSVQGAKLNQQAETITTMRRRLDAISAKLGID